MCGDWYGEFVELYRVRNSDMTPITWPICSRSTRSSPRLLHIRSSGIGGASKVIAVRPYDRQEGGLDPGRQSRRRTATPSLDAANRDSPFFS